MIFYVNGNYIQFMITSTCKSDIGAFRKIDLDFSINFLLYVDRTYNDYEFKDNLIHKKQIYIQPKEPHLFHL